MAHLTANFRTAEDSIPWLSLWIRSRHTCICVMFVQVPHMGYNGGNGAISPNSGAMGQGMYAGAANGTATGGIGHLGMQSPPVGVGMHHVSVGFKYCSTDVWDPCYVKSYDITDGQPCIGQLSSILMPKRLRSVTSLSLTGRFLKIRGFGEG